MLKTVVLLDLFEETVIDFQDSLMNKVQRNNLFEIKICCNVSLQYILKIWMIITLNFFKKKHVWVLTYIMNTHALLDRVPCVSSVWLCLSALGSAVLVGGVSLQPTGPGVIPAAVRGRAPQQNDNPAWFSRTLTPPSTSLPPIAGRNGEPGHRTGARVSCRPAECDTEFVWPPSARVSQRLRSLCSGRIV